MLFRRMTVAGAAALLLATCTSCQTEELDRNGDGQITQLELLSAAFDYVCGSQTATGSSSDEVTEDDPTQGSSADVDADAPTGEGSTGDQAAEVPAP